MKGFLIFLAVAAVAGLGGWKVWQARENQAQMGSDRDARPHGARDSGANAGKNSPNYCSVRASCAMPTRSYRQRAKSACEKW